MFSVNHCHSISARRLAASTSDSGKRYSPDSLAFDSFSTVSRGSFFNDKKLQPQGQSMALPWGGVLQVGDSAGWSDASGFENLVSDALKVGADEIGLAVKCHGHGLQLL
jgi:hypothetical protein